MWRGRRIELRRVGAAEPARRSGRTRSPRTACRGRSRSTARYARARSGWPGSFPRSRGRRSRRGRGCRRARRGGRTRPSRSMRSASTHATSTAASWAMPPWASASYRLLYESFTSMYFPMTPMRQRRRGALIRRTISSQRDSSVGPLGQAEELEEALVEPLVVEGQRDLIDRVDVARGDDGLLLDVAEERDLRLGRRRERVVLGGPAQEHVGLDADGPELLDGVLGGLGLELRRGLDVRHQREMHVDDVVLADVLLELAGGLEERKPSMSPTVPPISTMTTSTPSAELPDRGLDLVRDVGDHLDGAPEVVARAAPSR